MTQNKKDKSDYTPDWAEQVLNGMPDPTKKQLAKFDYLKEDVFQAFQDAYNKEGTLVHIVFSLTGRIINAAKDILVDVQEALEGAQPDLVPAAARGVENAGQRAVPQGHRIMGSAKKKSGAYLIKATTYRDESGTRLEIDIIHREDGTPVRPFEVSAKGENQQTIIDSFQVSNLNQTASFSGPSSGLYHFALAWANRQDVLSIQFG